MSLENFNLKKAEIEAITSKEVKTPDMPVGESIQESENLAAWCPEDQAALEKAGLAWSLVVDLPIRAGACRYAQSMWKRDFKNKEEAEEEWKERSPDAFGLRDELLHDFTYAFRKHPDKLAKVQAIREGGSRADMLQDLSDLNVLGKAEMDLLAAIGFDATKLDAAAQLAEDLSAVLAVANGDDTIEDNAKEMRDKAYTYMKQAVDEIRECGQYVFWRDEDRKKGYVSAYKKRMR